MKDCMLHGQCERHICDNACPDYVEPIYLLERNGLLNIKYVYSLGTKEVNKVTAVLQKVDSGLFTVVSDDTIRLSNILTYCAICENWQGNRLHCNVFHLNYSNHMDNIQRSWNYKEVPESLEYAEIWIQSAKILIVSNLDYIKFGDFQAQTLLNLIHNRSSNSLTTIVVTPKINTLVGTGAFFDRLKSILSEAVIKT